MAHGGARNRSGPQPDPDSGESERKGLVFSALPPAGYKGRIPKFPLPDPSERELEVWKEAWRFPQAAAWSRERWRWRTVAQWVRWSVRMEDERASASLGNVVVRLADQIGMTPAGLKENGWKIGREKPQARKEQAEQTRQSPRDRLKVVSGGSG